MLYNIFRPAVDHDNAIIEKRMLDVVVGNYKCDIPFSIELPDGIECATVIVVVIPKTREVDKGHKISGVSVMLFMDTYLSIRKYTSTDKENESRREGKRFLILAIESITTKEENEWTHLIKL